MNFVGGPSESAGWVMQQPESGRILPDPLLWTSYPSGICGGGSGDAHRPSVAARLLGREDRRGTANPVSPERYREGSLANATERGAFSIEI